MTTPLLTTKLYIPPVRPELVPRPSLIQRLNEGLDRKLTLISAPAGFGKTTLLSEWAAGVDRPEGSGGEGRKRRKEPPAEPRAALCAFLEQRLRFLMEDAGLRFDAARAALAAGWSDPLLAWRRGKALNALRGREDFLALAMAAKRVRNILAQAAGKGMMVDAGDLKARVAGDDFARGE